MGLKMTVAPLVDCGLWGVLWQLARHDASSWRRSTTGGRRVWQDDAGAAAELEMAGLDLDNSRLPNDGWYVAKNHRPHDSRKVMKLDHRPKQKASSTWLDLN